MQITERIQQLETRLQKKLPQSYIQFLQTANRYGEGSKSVRFRGELWPIRNFFQLSEGAPDDQLDACYLSVYDVLPPFTLPIAEDWAGNFFLLVIGGQGAGRIVWWDHERDAGDDSVELVTESFSKFIDALVNSEHG